VTEQTLHEQLKEIYSKDGGEKEILLGNYRVDVVQGDLLIEIQTRSFNNIKGKIEDLAESHRVRLVHPIAHQKWIIKLNKEGNKIAQRKSPKRGRVENLFYELVYAPKLLSNRNVEVEVVLIDLEEYWINDGKGSWRRRRWSIHDKKMIALRSQVLFREPKDFKKLLPRTLPPLFTSNRLSKEMGLSKRLTQKMLYCLTCMDIVERKGKRGRSYLYQIHEEASYCRSPRPNRYD